MNHDIAEGRAAVPPYGGGLEEPCHNNHAYIAAHHGIAEDVFPSAAGRTVEEHEVYAADSHEQRQYRVDVIGVPEGETLSMSSESTGRDCGESLAHGVEERHWSGPQEEDA